MIENRFTSTDDTFVDLDKYDACVDPAAHPVVADKSMPVWIGVDASVKRDSTAIVAVTWDDKSKKVRLIWHRVFQPCKTDPIDFEAMIEETILDLRRRFLVRRVHYDPYQMQASAQRLRRLGVNMFEFPQSVPNLTRASQNLFELIKRPIFASRYSAPLRLKAPAVGASPRTTSHKIDVVVALGMAALAAVRWGNAIGVR
jgi:phage terminase large subunit-like protein